MKSDKKLKRKIGALGVLGILVLVSISATIYAQSWPGTSQSESVSYRIIIDDNNDAGDEVFAVWHDGDGTGGIGSELLRLEETGRLGIGDTSPDFKLEVTGSSGSGYFGVTSSSDGDIFIIDSSGNVGIGTTTPDANLDVEVSGGGAAEIGDSSCSATGSYALAMGYSNEATGDYSFATGFDSSAGGLASFATVQGDAGGLGSVAMGWYSYASGDMSYAIGSLVKANEDYSMVLGRGLDGSHYLENDIENSLIIGFQSTTPTFYVDGSSVGIGITTPARKLDVLDSTNPQLRLSNSFAYYTDFQTTGSGHLYINPSGGRVGIGTSTPDAKLDVEVSSGGAAEIGDSGCSATGRNAVAMGSWTTASGYESTALGYETSAIGAASIASGVYSTASGSYSFATGGFATAGGLTADASGWYVTASGDCSAASGSFVTASADKSFVIGRGVDDSNRLVNNIESSLMVGFDSTEPTMFVDGSSVGIGTTDPKTKLQVDGDVSFKKGNTLNIDDDGEITVTHTYHWVDDSDEDDSLDTIIGGDVAGQVLIIRPADSTTITVIDGLGNLQLSGNFVMDNPMDTLFLIFDGTNWHEISRSNNG